MDKEKNGATGTEENEKNTNLPITNPSSNTYHEYRDEGGGGLEVDLVLLREKGQTVKYLLVTINGANFQIDPPIPTSASITISTQTEFEKFKNFIAQLKWE